jgi:hypothetical protein
MQIITKKLVRPDGRETDLVIDCIGGNCPVQATGTVADFPFYFRARGGKWRLAIGHNPYADSAWIHTERYGFGPYDASWMPEDEAIEAIERAALSWWVEQMPMFSEDEAR